MSNLVGLSLFSNPLWVAMETMHFHIAHTEYFEDTFVSHSGGPNKQFGTMKNCPGVQGNLNWTLGYPTRVSKQFWIPIRADISMATQSQTSCLIGVQKVSEYD